MAHLIVLYGRTSAMFVNEEVRYFSELTPLEYRGTYLNTSNLIGVIDDYISN